MLPVTANYRKTLSLSAPPAFIKDFFSDYKRSIGELFPGLENFELAGATDTYAWTFEEVSHSGLKHQVKLLTRFEWIDENILRIRSLPGSGNAILSGSIEIAQGQLLFDFTLQGELPIPRLLKSVVGPIVEKELQGLFDRYVKRVEETLHP